MTTQKLLIRYANPDTIPSTHKAAGYGVGVPTVQPHLDSDYWTLVGDQYALTSHIERALAANDLNDYRFV